MVTYLLPIGLLIASNVFMTFAWYGHLGHKAVPLWQAVLVSWGIAFFEYWLAVPANRIGHAVYTAAQLKTIQEVITLTIFGVFSVFWLREAFTWNMVLGFALIALGAGIVFPGIAAAVALTMRPGTRRCRGSRRWPPDPCPLPTASPPRRG